MKTKSAFVSNQLLVVCSGNEHQSTRPLTRLGHLMAITAIAAIAIGFATPSFAQVTVNQVNIPSNIGNGQDVNVGIDYVRLSAVAATITLPIPANMQVAPPAVPAPCVQMASNVVCTVPAGGAGSSGTISLQVRGKLPMGMASSGYSVTATSSTGSNASSTGNIRSAGDLQIAKAKITPAGAVVTGQAITFRLTPTINLFNGVADPIPAGTSVTITDNLPGLQSDYDVTAITASNPAVTCNAAAAASASRVITCTVAGPVAVGAMGTIDVVGNALTAGMFINNTAIQADNISYFDLNLGNNTASVMYAVGSGGDATPAGSSFPSSDVPTGSTKTLKLSFNNAGPTNIPAGGQVKGAIPAGITIGTLPAGCVNSGAGTVNGVAGTVITCTAGAVNNGNTQNFNIPLTMPAMATAGNFGVQVSMPAGFTDINLPNDPTLIPYSVAAPYADLGITKVKQTGPIAAGGNITNDITINNAGIAPAVYVTGVNPLAFVDTVSANETFVSVSPGWTCTNVPATKIACTKNTSGSLAVGASEPAVTVTTKVSAAIPMGATTLTNTACTGATGAAQGPFTQPSPADTKPGNDCSTQSVIGTTADNMEAQSSIVKQSSADGITYGSTSAIPGAGNSVYWKMTITTPTVGANPTQATIPTINLGDNIPGILNVGSPGAPLPGYVTPAVTVTAALTGGSATSSCITTPTVIPAGGPGTLSCDFNNVAPGTTIVVTYRVDRPFDAGTLMNTGNLTSPNAFLTASAGGQLSSTATATVAPRVDIAATAKTLNPPNTATEPRIGQAVEFTVSAQNYGPNDLAGVMTITDNIDTAKYDVLSVLGSTMDCTASNLVTGAISCGSTTAVVRYDTRSILIKVRPKKTGMLTAGANDIAFSTTNTANVSLNTGTNCEFKTETVSNPSVSALCNDANSITNNAKSVTFDVKVPRLDLQQRKSRVLPMGQTSFGISDPLRYLFRIQNNGPSRAEGVKMTDTLTVPAGFTLSLPSVQNINVAAAEAGYTIDGTKSASVTCNQTAAANADIVCVLAGAAPTSTNANNFLDSGNEVNFEVVMTMTGSGTTPVTFGNSVYVCADESTNYESAGACSPTPAIAGNNLASVNDVVFPKTDLTITKTTVGPTPANINQPIAYDLVLKNLGPGGSTQMRVSDVLPPNFEFIASGPNAPSISVGGFVSGSGLTAQTVSCSVSPAAIATVGDQQTVSCIANATGGTMVFPGNAAATNTVTVRIYAKAKEGFFTGPYLTNLANNATISVGQDAMGNPLSIDTVSTNNNATSNSQIQKASIGGRTFFDANGNRNQDGPNVGQDEGIPSVAFTLTGTDAYGNVISRMVTSNANAAGPGSVRGDYLFDNLPPSDATGYTITQTQPAGFVNELPTVGAGPPLGGTANGGTVGTPTNGAMNSVIPSIVLTAASNGINFNFPETQGATESGFVYADANNNGQKDVGDTAITGVTMKLTGTDILGMAVSLTTPLLADGSYSFSVPLSDATGYTVEELTQPAGYFDGKEIVGQIAMGNPPAGNVVASSSNPLGAATYSAGGIATGTTNAPTDKITGIIPVAGQIHHDNNFGELSPPQISGTVYLDPNNSATKDLTELTGVQGVTITLTGTDLNGNAVSKIATTDVNGNYAFTNLLPGTYSVSEGAVPAYSHTGSAAQGPNALGTNFLSNNGMTTSMVAAGTPAGGIVAPAINTIVIGPGGNSPGNNFGELPSTLAGKVCVDNGAGALGNNGKCDAGETPINMVTVTLTGIAIDGTVVNIMTTTDALGVYLFKDLKLPNAAGYTITETQPAGYLDGKQTVGVLTPVTAGVDAGAALGAATTAINTDVISGIKFTKATNGTVYDFGELRPSSIAGFVYADSDNNMVRTVGVDPGLSGVTVTLTGTDIDGNMVTTVAMTLGSGAYSFPNLRPGVYSVVETQPVYATDSAETIGTGVATPGTIPLNDKFAITLKENENAVDFNFGEVATTLSGYVYEDLNFNGLRDPGEPGIAGVQMQLSGTDILMMPVSITVTTLADGSYMFTGLKAANATGYTVREVMQPAAYADAKESVGTVAGMVRGNAAVNDVISGIQFGAADTGINFNFGEVRLGSIAGNVYVDANNNGTKDASDPPIGNVLVTLTGIDLNGGGVTLTATTDSAGKYSFGGLLPGVYTVTETQPASYGDATTTAGSLGGSVTPNKVSNISLGSGASSIENNFGEKLLGITGTVFVDNNNDGVQGANEVGIPGVTLKLTGKDASGNPVSVTVVTDATGKYVFANLPPSDAAGYTITETQPTTYVEGKTTPGTGGGVVSSNGNVISGIVLGGANASPTLTGYNFGEISGGIGGQVYVDTNNNGIRDAGELPIPGVTVTLTGTDSAGNAVSRTAVTDADGQYLFSGLLASNAAGYTITETQPTLYADGKDKAGVLGGVVTNDRVANIVFPGTSVSLGYDFGELGASIAGKVYSDNNNNGLIDNNELPIANVKVTLTGTDANGNPVSRTVTTGPDGTYRFDGLPLSGPNGYTITETQPTGYIDGLETIGSLGGTVPANDNFNVKITVPGSNGTDYNFGERIQNPGAVCGRVFLDINGDRSDNDGAGTGQISWIVELTVVGANGVSTIISTVRTGSNGEYCFNDLPPGTFTVVFRNPASGITAGRISNIVVGTGTTILKQDLPLDPSGVIFDNCSGLPIEGAKVFIMGPAGFDPKIHLTDAAMQGQTVGADGFYQILLTPNAPVGVYTLSLVAPPGYTSVGAALPQTTVLNATTCPVDPNPVAPCLVNPTAKPTILGMCTNGPPPPGPIYFNQILIGPTAQDVLNNHIGLTALPTGTAIDLRKTVSKLNVVRGELVPYTITIRNVSMAALNNVNIVDTPPPGFRFVPGSARLSIGTPPVTSPVVPTVDGSNLAVKVATLAVNQSASVTLLLSPTVGVSEGNYVNNAIARAGNPRGGALSNLGQAQVRIIADPLFDCTDITGKAFDDRNANGYQDEGEPGLVAARIVSARGITATTDSEGRYHIACAAIPAEDIGSNFILKLDERSLPSGYRVTTDNPLVERLTRGKVMKMNFGATIHRVIRLDVSDMAFDNDKATLRADYVKRLDDIVQVLRDRPSILRVGYVVTRSESESLINSRIAEIKANIAERWSHESKKPKNKDDKERVGQYGLDIEVEVVRDVNAAAVSGGVK